MELIAFYGFMLLVVSGFSCLIFETKEGGFPRLFQKSILFLGIFLIAVAVVKTAFF